MEVGIGPTDELSLRVSVAALARVLFKRPKDGEVMLALERKATLLEGDSGRVVEVKSQPFGGALRILDLEALCHGIGDFHFDSKRSYREQDLRIFINPSAWNIVREFCLQHLTKAGDPVLESDPWREMTEEFAKTLGVDLNSEQLSYKPVGTLLENVPLPTENAYAPGFPTARVYRIFEAHVLDRSLAHHMLSESARYSNQDLQNLAREDTGKGGHGRVNTVLTLPLKHLSAFYAAIPLEARTRPVSFQEHRLDETVAAVLEEVTVPKYQRI